MKRIVEVNHVEALEVISEQGGRHWSLTQETLKVPKINTYDLLGEESLKVLQVDVVEAWMTPYQCTELMGCSS